MDQFQPVLEAFDMLDLMLAVFGAIIVAMWFGRGKGPWGIISGAMMGGLVKPALFLLMASGLISALQGSPEIRQTPEQQDATLKFWTK
jgi:hypothetical protein